MPTTTDTASAHRVLAINGGSSSIKFAIFEAGQRPVRKLSGAVERIGLADCVLKIGAEERALPSVYLSDGERGMRNVSLV